MVKKGEADTKPLLASILRMADLSVCLMCEMKRDENLPELTMYQTTIQKLEKAYKPYLDKSRMDRRIQEMKEEMEHLKTLAVQDQPSLLYGQKHGGYGNESYHLCGNGVSTGTGKKNSFVEQSKEEQKTEPDTTEQMELEMGG